MVKLFSETKLDASGVDHRNDLADSLPNHSRQLRVCVRPDVSRQGKLAGRTAVRHQPCGKLNLHSDPVWNAEPATGCVGYFDRMGNDHLVHDRNLAALQMGIACPSAILHLGIACDGIAIEHHLDELGSSVILGLFQTTLTKIMAT